jgi:hypothetical protein
LIGRGGKTVQSISSPISSIPLAGFSLIPTAKQHPTQRNGGPFAGLVAVLIVTACAPSTPIVREKFDPLTAVTVSFSNTPLVMYRGNSARGALARRYVLLGPIQVNRSGNYQYFLWLGTWSTGRSIDPAEYRHSLGSITILVDSEPLSLDVSGWTPESIGTSEPVYATPVASSADAYYRITADQIRLLAGAKEIRLRTSGTEPGEYKLWDDQDAARSDLIEFINRVF